MNCNGSFLFHILKIYACIFWDRCPYIILYIIRFLVANTITFSLATYFALLLYYSLLARPVFQLFILQEVLINITTIKEFIRQPSVGGCV